jgi:hypothetical protein
MLLLLVLSAVTTWAVATHVADRAALKTLPREPGLPACTRRGVCVGEHCRGLLRIRSSDERLQLTHRARESRPVTARIGIASEKRHRSLQVLWWQMPGHVRNEVLMVHRRVDGDARCSDAVSNAFDVIQVVLDAAMECRREKLHVQILKVQRGCRCKFLSQHAPEVSAVAAVDAADNKGRGSAEGHQEHVEHCAVVTSSKLIITLRKNVGISLQLGMRSETACPGGVRISIPIERDCLDATHCGSSSSKSQRRQKKKKLNHDAVAHR